MSVNPRLPSLTVITPSLNHGSYIAKSIDSVGMRPSLDYEHIIVDGGSTDETLNVLAQRPGLSVHIRPEFDSHQALNYGITLAQGDIIGFLNTDDFYERDGVCMVLEHFARHPDTQMLCGGMRTFRDRNGVETLVSLFPHASSEDMPLELTFGHPGFNSWFFRRSFLKSLGGFRTRYSFAADRDLLLRGYALAPAIVIPQLVYHYRMHEASRTMDPRGTNRQAMIMDHLELIQAQMREIWAGNPRMLSLLRHWYVLEQFKLVHRSVRYGTAPFWSTIRRTSWPQVPRALALRRRWLRLLFSYPHGGSDSRRN